MEGAALAQSCVSAKIFNSRSTKTADEKVSSLGTDSSK